jgi:arabinogalactan oligomer/maltooligosaccharide transport system permease protein
VVVAILTVLVICGAALGLGLGISSLLSSILDRGGLPDLPAWSVIPFAAAALVPILVLALRAFPWLLNWYYLLPALVFLLAFTVYPIALTVGYALTNYSAQNSGRPDSSATVEVRRAGDRQLSATGNVAESLRCEQPSCAGRPVSMPDERSNFRRDRLNTIDRVEGNTIYLRSPLLAGFNPAELQRVNQVDYVGFQNFADIFARAGVQLWPIFVWTAVFAVSTTVLNVLTGLVLGILLNNKRLKFRNFYRTILFLPWAVPGVISIQMWVSLLNTNFGGLNRLFGLVGALPAPWLTDPTWYKIAILLVNLWLGFPYMMTATLGALSSIPDELYEAAQIDGASRWQQVRSITLPMLQAAFTPIALSTFAFNFNNFGIIYLLSGGGPATATDISPGQERRHPDLLGLQDRLRERRRLRLRGGERRRHLRRGPHHHDQRRELPRRRRLPGGEAMSAPPVRVPSSGASWRSVLGWVLLAAAVFGLVVLVGQLRSTLAPPSFAIVRPENGARNALLGLLAAVGVLAFTSYLGKLWGERSRAGRKVSYVAVLGDQLTHLVFWIVILVALYPIFYVVPRASTR